VPPAGSVFATSGALCAPAGRPRAPLLGGELPRAVARWAPNTTARCARPGRPRAAPTAPSSARWEWFGLT